MAPSSFQKLWNDSTIQDAIFDHLSPSEKASLRLVSSVINKAITPSVFHTVKITFRPSTFTKPVRMVAFDRIGHHVQHLIFNLPHTPDTFLPPLIDPCTGEERNFHYVPQIFPPSSPQSRKKDPKYGSLEMNELLTQQYSPLFHASTNVPAFIRAFSAMRSLEHLTIVSEGQESAFRYRRCTVDYALISLRIAVERSPLSHLKRLSLNSIHPGAIYYLRPLGTFGASPAAVKRWRQITKLDVSLDGWPFDAVNARPDHLKMLHTYLEIFASSLVDFSFTWKSHRGPCPLTLHKDPLMTSTSENGTSSSKESAKNISRLDLPRLRTFRLFNVLMSSDQVSSLVHAHRRTLQTADFADVLLSGSGDWNAALACLTDISGSSRWRERSRPSSTASSTIDPALLPPLPDSSESEAESITPTMDDAISPVGAANDELLWPTTMCAPIEQYIPVSQMPLNRAPPEAIEVPIIISRSPADNDFSPTDYFSASNRNDPYALPRRPLTPTPEEVPTPEEMPTPEPWDENIRQEYNAHFSPSGSTLTVAESEAAASTTTTTTTSSAAMSGLSLSRTRSASASTSLSTDSGSEPLPTVIQTPSPRAIRAASAAPPPLRPRKRLFCEEKDLPAPPALESPALPTPTPGRLFGEQVLPPLPQVVPPPSTATDTIPAAELARLSLLAPDSTYPLAPILEHPTQRLTRSNTERSMRRRSSQPILSIASSHHSMAVAPPPAPLMAAPASQPPTLTTFPSPMLLQPSVYVPPSVPARGLAAATAIAVAVPGTPGRRVVKASAKVEQVVERRSLWKRCQVERERRIGSGREKWLGASEAMRDFLRGSVYLWR